MSNMSEKKKLYPNCDGNIWLRSCEQEVIEPIDGTISGVIPKWLNGSLLRNGPGSLKVGDMRFNHLFDSSALIHRFAIKGGNVTYQNRFLQTDTYKKNKAANRIVVTEFGTKSVPDPCHSIFKRVTAIFKQNDVSDNAMISIYPFGDEYFAFTEFPFIHKINAETLSTEKRVNLTEYTGIVSHTSHPHVLADGTVYNLGMTIGKTGPQYNIICFPHGANMFDQAHVVATLPVRWILYPSYMHTFGLTDNYFIIVEQPLSLSIPEMLKSCVVNQPLLSHFKWFANAKTNIYLISRSTGALSYTFQADAFFYLHIINAYEQDNHVILDICCYKDPAMLECMFIESIENMQQNDNFANMFRGRPLRFVMPLSAKTNDIEKPSLRRSLSISNLISKLNPKPALKKSDSLQCDMKEHAFNTDYNSNCKNEHMNLVTLKNTEAKAFELKENFLFCTPEILCDLGCETPRISYETYMGKPYRYFYAISSDVDVTNPGTLIKVDLKTKTRKTWCEENCYPSEPIFVPHPEPKSEDDGIVMSAMVWGKDQEDRVGLLVLCAKSWIELGRCEFQTPGPVPKCLHGWFAPIKL